MMCLPYLDFKDLEAHFATARILSNALGQDFIFLAIICKWLNGYIIGRQVSAREHSRASTEVLNSPDV